jgi:hypothetical protein
LLPHFVEKRYIIDIKEYKIVMKEFFWNIKEHWFQVIAWILGWWWSGSGWYISRIV